MKKLLIMSILAISLQADVLLHKSLFSQGSKSIGLRVGSASINHDSYLVGGVSGNYFIVDNLSIGLGYERWFLGDPTIQKLTVDTTYHIRATESLRPYLGLLYRRNFIENYNDVNSYGYRAGVSVVNQDFTISIGFVQEKYETKREVFNDTQTSIELLFGFAF